MSQSPEAEAVAPAISAESEDAIRILRDAADQIEDLTAKAAVCSYLDNVHRLMETCLPYPDFQSGFCLSEGMFFYLILFLIFVAALFWFKS